MARTGLNTSMIPSLGTAFNVGTGVLFGYMEYADQRDRGNGVIQSAASAGLEAVLPELMGTPLYLAGQAVNASIDIGMSVYDNLQQQKRQLDKASRNQMPFKNYTFVDSPQIYTMRQAGMALAQQSKYKLQQTMMGNEAQYLHR